jgi:hypothetical protein
MITQETDNEEIEVLLNDCYGGWKISSKANKLYTLRKTNNSSNYLSRRSDPILIQIYNELGDEFDEGKYSKTGIEKIPKKYENHYYISEYDGLERVEIDYTKYELDNLKKNIKEILENNSIDNDEKINQFNFIINNRCVFK